MRVATKVATGSGLLAALLIGVLTYFVLVVRQLVGVNQELTAVHFRTTTVALELLHQLDQLEQNARKFFVTRDPGYADRVTDARDAFATGLAELEVLTPRTGQPVTINRLGEQWRRFAFAPVPRQEMASRLGATSDAELLEVLAAPLERLHLQTWAVLTASRDGIAAQVRRTVGAGLAAQRLSLVVAWLALLLAVLIVILTVRSIKEPLQRLTEGTRAVARGTFTYQLDTSRGDEFAELAEDFNTMVRRLEELDQMKREFVSHVSHELKTPLVAMQETNRLLLDGPPGPLTERQRRLLELNLQGSRRLSAMISNLLDLARLEAGVMRYDFRPHDLGALTRTSASELEALAQEKGVRFDLDVPYTPLPVHCDADRLSQVLVNLLDNATKFSPREGVVTVKARAEASLPTSVPRDLARTLAAPDSGRRYAALEIADHGPGIPDRNKRLVFEKFHQAEKGSKQASAGVGLGLAICREILHAHAGEIWVADNCPTGCVFTFVLPLQTPGDEPIEGERVTISERTTHDA
jgi:two-component system sensor histidine kinase GlrK